MENATFFLQTFKFPKVGIDLSKKVDDDINIKLEPSGQYNAENSTFFLTFEFNAFNKEEDNAFINILCVANFKFENVASIENIPNYFYQNSIAIVFPYIRAFISTVTLQANINPLVLPTFNLSSLAEPLMKNSISI